MTVFRTPAPVRVSPSEAADPHERRAAWSGAFVVLFGAAAEVFERMPVTAADFAEHRAAVLTQSMLFLAGAAAALWFFSAVRARMVRAEGEPGRIAALAHGAALSWVGVNIVAQAVQIGLANDPTGQAPVALIATAAALMGAANLPLAVCLAAVAIGSLRHGAFPRWSGLIAVAAAIAQAVLWAATVVGSGPLATGGWLNTLLYPVFLFWLAPAAVVMVRDRG
jgi:hypothetical protein